MTVLGVRVRVSPTANDVVVLLREEEQGRAVPILIGPHEGVAIASAQSGVTTGRPGPYDLIISVTEASGVSLTRVEVVELRDGIFIAELVLSNGKRIDSRTSDAIAVALRAGVDVYCAEEIVDEAGLFLDTDDEEEETYHTREVDTEAEVAQFRSFLDEVDPADFGEPDEQ